MSTPQTGGAQFIGIDALMRTARIFAAITAESVAQAGDSVTLPQLRVLFVASSRSTVNNTEVAQALDVHLYNASRICDRLVQARLLRRRESPDDRRRVELSLTPQGEELLQSATAHRRSVLTRILRQLHPPDRVALAAALDTFSDAGEESIERGISPV